MVIGERFAWCHMGKTGGDATLAMFRAVPRLIHFADPDDGNDKHIAFSKRQEMIRGKVLAINIRRLPAWIISYAKHISTRGLYPDYTPRPMMTGDEMAECTAPDQHLMIYSADVVIEHWLRTENLKNDFVRFVLNFTALQAEDHDRLNEVGQVNAATYDHDISQWLTRSQVRKLYAMNPAWSFVEKDVYGNTI